MGNNVQLNVDQQSYGENPITDDINNVTKNCDQDITKTRNILEQTENMMKDNCKKSERQITIRCNDASQFIPSQLMRSPPGMSTKSRNQCQTYLIFLDILPIPERHSSYSQD